MTWETSAAVCCWCGGHLKRLLSEKEDELSPWWCLAPDCYRRQAEWAVGQQEVDKKGRPTGKVVGYLYVPTPAQTWFHETRLTPEILASLPVRKDGRKRRPRLNRMYGGAAGPGKSHGERWDQYRKAAAIPGFSGAILRRTNPELEKTHLRAFERDASKIGAEFLTSKNMLKWPNGSIIECGHCEDDRAVQKWLSTEYDQIGIDEASTFEPKMLLEISTRARTSKPAVKAAGGPWFDVVTNPGGPAWALLCDLFVNHRPDYDQFPQLRGHYFPQLWVYCKALLDTNPYLDESYEDDLRVLGSEARYRQLRFGEEFVTEGAFFGQWRETREGEPWHVAERDVTGAQWFASMDWGYNAPGVILWWACLPDGEYHIKAEWKFREASAEEIGGKFAEVSEAVLARVNYVACDPAMWGRTGAGRGESVAETLLRFGVPVRRSDNDRKLGWARVQSFLRENPQGRPWLTVDPGCTYGRRTMPSLVQDKHDPDDLDTSKDDHWADALRYGAMSRPSPWVKREPEPPPPPPNSWGFWRSWHARQEKPTGVLA